MDAVHVVLLILAAIVAAFLYWRFVFFLRNPVRTVPEEEDRIVSAADGYITYVKKVNSGEVPIAVKGKRIIPLTDFLAIECCSPSGYLIGTCMTEFSVHRNRVPISGEIVWRNHRSAAPRNLSMVRMISNLLFKRMPLDEDCEYLIANERLTIAIKSRTGDVVTVTQIADMWINRIIARVEVGDYVQRGQQYGMIRFGSQCDVFIPDALVDRIAVSPGDSVKAGESTLAFANSE